jgi:acetyl-CoA C-acetyltransferase
MQDVVIVAAARTPIGSFQGALSSLSATQLGAGTIKAAVERAGVPPADVSEVIMGQVLGAGAGQAPARQAAIHAGLPTSVPCTTINKVCGSGLKAVMLARQAIALGEADVVVAGGMESMSNAPYLLPGARAGYRMGNAQILDALIHDGLWDPFGEAVMGSYGDRCAAERGFSRQAQDAFAQLSYERAITAQRAGLFDDEIVPVSVRGKGGLAEVTADEEPSRYKPEKLPTLPPAFGKDGSVTAANASKLSDGAAALVLMSRAEAHRRGCRPLATVVADATFAQEPAWFTTAPPGAVRLAAKRAGVALADIDLFEINEAFAVVALSAIRDLGLDETRVNVRGGAISLGHPIGCSGARVLVTLIGALRHGRKRLGCATLCLGGGEAVAMIVRREDE